MLIGDFWWHKLHTGSHGNRGKGITTLYTEKEATREVLTTFSASSFQVARPDTLL